MLLFIVFNSPRGFTSHFIIKGLDVHSITSADTIKVDTSSSSLSSSESDSSFGICKKRPRLDALSESSSFADNSCEVRFFLLHLNLSYHNQHNIKDPYPMDTDFILLKSGRKKYIDLVLLELKT